MSKITIESAEPIGTTEEPDSNIEDMAIAGFRNCNYNGQVYGNGQFICIGGEGHICYDGLWKKSGGFCD